MDRVSSWAGSIFHREPILKRGVWCRILSPQYNGHSMAKKKDPQQVSVDSARREVAKSIADVAGTNTSPLSATPSTKSTKVPKLAKKNKSHLPRREKKARRKAANLL